MQKASIDRTMPLRVPALALLCAMAIGGCVSTGTHTKTLAELEAAKKATAHLQQKLDQEAPQRKAAEQQAVS
jgi:outer membrane murein-binding lipoprotein Lpp